MDTRTFRPVAGQIFCHKTLPHHQARVAYNHFTIARHIP